MHQVSPQSVGWTALTALSRALKEEHKIQLHLEALHLRIKKLRRHGRDLDVKAEDGHTATEDAVQTYAKDICLKLCTKVHQIFPREIRDIIYGYITDCEELTVSELPPRSGSRKSSRDSSLPYFSSVCVAQVRYQNAMLEPEHWWLPGFVGPETLRELGEHYYRTTAFRFKGRFHDISRFRVTDQWNLGFLPVTFVSNIELGLTCEGQEFRVHKDDGDGSGATPHPWGSAWDESPSDPRDQSMTISTSELLVQLEALFGFRKGTAITINIRMGDYNNYSDLEKLSYMSEYTVPVLLPTLIRLQGAGCKVRFVLDISRTDVWSARLSRKFISPWNPVSEEELSKSFLKVC